MSYEQAPQWVLGTIKGIYGSMGICGIVWGSFGYQNNLVSSVGIMKS